jgi:hypothetical protein
MRLHLISALLATLLGVNSARAHKASDSYLTIRLDERPIQLCWDLALRDLEAAVGLDVDDDGQITWGELKSRQDAITTYALSHLQIISERSKVELDVAEFLVDYHSDGAYVVLVLKLRQANVRSRLQLHYSALFDIDRQHRAILHIESDGRTETAVLGPDQRSYQIDGQPQTGKNFRSFIREGVWHIWTGFDHLLFLAVLLLPTLLQGGHFCGRPDDPANRTVSNILKTVTAFTFAHSLTLALAVFQVVSIPARFIEAAIAGSVVIAAANNLVPLLRARGWVLAGSFGLIHGFGFANVLGDLSLPRHSLAVGLFGFNLGVELGQLAVVGILLPVIFLGRRSLPVRRVTLVFGSGSIALVAAIWMAERIFDARLLPF